MHTLFSLADSPAELDADAPPVDVSSVEELGRLPLLRLLTTRERRPLQRENGKSIQQGNGQ